MLGHCPLSMYIVDIVHVRTLSMLVGHCPLSMYIRDFDEVLGRPVGLMKSSTWHNFGLASLTSFCR